MPLLIEEILGPSDQGRSRPYKCRAEDGAIYYVKGRQTDRASLWHEWVCAHLAKALGLALPQFAVVEVGEDLLAETSRDWREIGTGPAFGSRLHDGAVWLEPSMANMVPMETQRDVLVFDWWVHNMDRTVGNPNLLWDTAEKKLVVIDHNLAFDAQFNAHDFARDHIFSDVWPSIYTDLARQADYARRLCEALPAALTACENTPLEWAWANAEMDIPARFDRAAMLAVLSRCATPELWRTV